METIIYWLFAGCIIITFGFCIWSYVKKQYQTTTIIIFGLSLLFLVVSIVLNVSKYVITDTSIVLTFIGILATFIVVSNYAQVIEIRGSTQEKIDELNLLIADLVRKMKEMEDLESDIAKVSGDASRIFGGICTDKKLYRIGVAHLIMAVTHYQREEFDRKIIIAVLNLILNNLEQEKWCTDIDNQRFDYEYNINSVKEFSNSFEQKEKIISLLEQYKNKEDNNKRNTHDKQPSAE